MKRLTRIFRRATVLFGELRRRLLRHWSLGRRGERLAARHLRRQKMLVVGRGVRVDRGELDLVAVDGDVVVFVEVKTRRSTAQGHPAEAVDEHKARQLTRLALCYLHEHELLECRWRIDIVAITWPRGGRPQIAHLRGAVEPAGETSMFA